MTCILLSTVLFYALIFQPFYCLPVFIREFHLFKRFHCYYYIKRLFVESNIACFVCGPVARCKQASLHVDFIILVADSIICCDLSSIVLNNHLFDEIWSHFAWTLELNYFIDIDMSMYTFLMHASLFCFHPDFQILWRTGVCGGERALRVSLKLLTWRR